MPLPAPHRKFVSFVKKNAGGLGMLVVANIIFMMAYQLALIIVILPMTIAMMVLQMGMIPLTILSGGICAPFLCLFMFLFMILLLAFEFAALSAFYGWDVYLARKVLDVKKGRKIEIKNMMDEVKLDWRYYFNKGAGMLGFYLVVIFPVTFFIIMIPTVFMMVLVFALDTPYFILAFILYYLVIIFLSILFAPISQFILDVGSLRIAQGMRSWEGMFEALRDIWRRRRLFGPYYLTLFVIMLGSLFIFPLSSLIQWILPVATRAFIVSNDDL